MDSTTFVLDFFYQRCPDLQPADWNYGQNQAGWLKQKFRESPAVLKILVWHHPLVSVGKRHFKDSCVDYLPKEVVKGLAELRQSNSENAYFNQTGYSSLLKAVLEEEKILPDVVLNAHDHFLGVSRLSLKDGKDKTKTCIQLTSGAGGGKLQHMLYYYGQQQSPFFTEEHGVIKMTIYPEGNYKAELLSTAGKRWQFFRQDLNQIPAPPAADPQIIRLREITSAAVEGYLNWFAQEQTKNFKQWFNSTTFSTAQINNANTIRNLLTCTAPIAFNDARRQILELLRVYSPQDPQSLVTRFNAAYLDEFGVTPDTDFNGQAPVEDIPDDAGQNATDLIISEFEVLNL